MRLIIDRSPVLSGQSRKKTRLILVVLLFWFMVIIFRLIDLQVLEHKKLKQEVIEQSQDLITICRPEERFLIARAGFWPEACRLLLFFFTGQR